MVSARFIHLVSLKMAEGFGHIRDANFVLIAWKGNNTTLCSNILACIEKNLFSLLYISMTIVLTGLSR
jgi:hypothetical protein